MAKAGGAAGGTPTESKVLKLGARGGVGREGATVVESVPFASPRRPKRPAAAFAPVTPQPKRARRAGEAATGAASELPQLPGQLPGAPAGRGDEAETASTRYTAETPGPPPPFEASEHSPRVLTPRGAEDAEPGRAGEEGKGHGVAPEPGEVDRSPRFTAAAKGPPSIKRQHMLAKQRRSRELTARLAGPGGPARALDWAGFLPRLGGKPGRPAAGAFAGLYDVEC